MLNTRIAAVVLRRATDMFYAREDRLSFYMAWTYCRSRSLSANGAAHCYFQTPRDRLPLRLSEAATFVMRDCRSVRSALHSHQPFETAQFARLPDQKVRSGRREWIVRTGSRHPTIGLADFFEEYSVLTQNQILELVVS
jgi:hypothetical protein